MTWHWLSINVNEKWIDFEVKGLWNKTVIIKYDDKPVITEKIGILLNRRKFDFDIVEEDSSVHYSIEVFPVYNTLGFTVLRNGTPLLVTNQNREVVFQYKTIKAHIVCYAAKDTGEFIEIPYEVANMGSSSVYCFVDHSREIIYLWKGRNASSKSIQLGVQCANNLRNNVGLGYRIHPITEGDESHHFREIFG